LNSLDLDEICQFVNSNIDEFHRRRVEIISNLKLDKLIKKNPYLCRAKNITKASELIDGTLEAFLSSSEEKLFGDFLENLTIFVAGKTIGGRKSGAPGIDLEFEKDDVYHIVSIKSSTNWGNSSQHRRLAQDFATAERRLRQSKLVKPIQKMLGICYGKTKTVSTNDGYIKIVGQSFWTYISGNKKLYIDIIEPLGYRAREHNEIYHKERSKIANRLTFQFIERFCDESGLINWQKLVEANSGNYDLDVFFGYSG